jgi:transcriptional regulator of acetoin/glycerol metabolism
MRALRTNFRSSFHDAERRAIIDTLKAASGKIASAGGAGGRLGLNRTTRQNKIHQLNIRGPTIAVTVRIRSGKLSR